MSKAVWGPIYWAFIHTLAEKLKPEHFTSQRESLFNILTKMCDTLPCPECRNHANSNLRTAKLNLIKTREHFIDFLYEFHNRVNRQTGKPAYPKERLGLYSTYSLEKVVQQFLRLYGSSSRNSRMMADVFHRQQMYRWLVAYFRANNGAFNR